MELLPTIANYFGVTIDRLLSNDVTSKEADIKQFYENLNNFEHGSLEKIQYIENTATDILLMTSLPLFYKIP